MTRIFLDTNVLLDVLLKREPFFLAAQEIWSETIKGALEAGISVLSIHNIFFILNKLGNKKKAYQAIEEISHSFCLVEVSEAITQQAIAMKWPDFEDAVQYLCAREFGAEVFITRDRKGFKESSLPILTSHQFCSSIAT